MKKRNLKTFIISLCFILASGFSAPARATVNLSEAYKIALAYSPLVEGAQQTYLGAHAAVSEVGAKRLPVLEFRSAFTRSDHPVYVFGTLLQQGKFAQEHFSIPFLNEPPPRTNFRNALELGVPLFTGLELSDRKAQAKYGKSMAETGVEAAKMATGLRVIEHYLQVLTAKEKTKVLEMRIESAENELRSAEKLMKRGLVLGSDYYAARGLLYGLKAELHSMKSRYETQLWALKVLLGQKRPDPLEVTGILSDPTYTIASEKDLLSAAMRRPDIRIAEMEKEIAGKTSSIENRSFWPRVVAFGSIETNTEDFSKNPSQRMGGVRLETPIGDPSYFARKKKARFFQKAAESHLQQQKDNATADVAMLYRAYEGRMKMLESIKEAKDNAAVSLKKFRPLYLAGKQSVLEVLRAEEALAKAESSYLDVAAWLHMTYAQLMAASGQLSLDQIQQINAELMKEKTNE